MNTKLFALALTAAVLAVGCSNSAEMETKLTETQKSLSDTVSYYSDTLASLHAHTDSLQKALNALMPQARTTSSGGSSSTTTTPKTTKPAPQPIKKKIDVDTRGKSTEGATTEPYDAGEKIDVKKRGKSSGGG